MTPVINQRLTLPEHGRAIELLGIDPISRTKFNPGGKVDRLWFEPEKLISEPRSAIISRTTAAELGLRTGSYLTVNYGPKTARLKIIALLPPPHSPGGLVKGLIIVDIATAQEVLQLYHGISHINLLINDNYTATHLNKTISAAYGDELELLDLAAESRRIKRMTAAFYSNLNALSLMALLVGMFLIYNTETFIILQRRKILGCLRALGVSRRQVLQSILIEASCIGVIGSLGGIILGVFLADSLLGIVSTTINDLYFKTSIDRLSVASTTLFGSFSVGVASTLLAALIPALQATRIEPTLMTNRNSVQPPNIRQICIIAGIIFFLCNLLSWFTLEYSQSPNAGFVGISLVVFGFAAICPLAIIALSAGTRWLLSSQRFLPERHGLRTVSTAVNRTGPASAALMIATAASIGIGIMIMSFRVSVSDWLDTALRADLYVSGEHFDNQSRGVKLSPAFVEKIERLDEVTSTSTVLRQQIKTPSGNVQLSAYKLNAAARQGFQFKVGDSEAIWVQWEDSDVVIITEPYAHHNLLDIGDDLQIKTNTGERRFQIVGIYADYASERGNISMSRNTYDRHWERDDYDGIGIYVAPNVSIADAASSVTAVINANSTIVVNSAAELKQTSLEVFDRTFLITELLRAIAVIVSVIGILGALLAQQLERTREYGVLRAIGFTIPEMGRTILTQTFLLGATAAMIAIPVGILIGVILIEVVNPRSFGWTMIMQIPTALMVKSFAIAVLAALGAGLYPSYRAARIEVTDAMRYE
tara:strand:+ start:2521 stop:4806 length:2286 start_codon:yes stop_codon:yes gene_type:complete